MCIDRRQLVLGSVSFGACSIVGASIAHAQSSFRILCSWSGGRNQGQGLSPATGTAHREVADIANAIGFRIRMRVFIGGVPNAAATTMGGVPTIVYNPGFLDRLARCNRAAALSVLAHEVGHHANRDTAWQARQSSNNPWRRELGADWVSGLAMRRLGISHDNALSGIICSFGVFSSGSESHPDSQSRLRAVSEGWYAA